MCFEFEWLYWAQMAQEEEQRRRDAANRVDTQSSGQSVTSDDDAIRSSTLTQSLADAQRQEQRKPLHA
jgi:hypothetical protein